jgi:hypothetical protein
MIMTDLEIQEYIENNCRNEHGEPMMDEQTFYEGAKWYRDKVVNKLNIPVVIASTWIFFYEGEEDKPQFKVQANAQWEAYQTAQEHFGDQVEDMMYKML